MKPITLIILLVVAIGISATVRLQFNGRVAELHTRSSDSRSRSKDRVEPIRVPEANWNRQGIAGESPASPANSSHDPETNRIISELVETGMTQEEAALHYKRVSEMARIERSTRRPMPSVRTNVDVKRFPLFEE